MPVDCGSITASSALAATAASAAVPPARITSMATSAAAGCDVATMAFWAWTVERPAKWKFLIAIAFLQAFLEHRAGLQTVLGIFIPCGAMAGSQGSHDLRRPAKAGPIRWLSPARPA